MAAVSEHSEPRGAKPDYVQMPAPTPWPIVLAFGVALVCAGLVTSASVSWLGALLTICGSVGWFREVLPHEQHVEAPVEEAPAAPVSPHRTVERVDVAPELPRALLPLETYPVSAGIKGGLAGAVAMAVCACLYGIIHQGSIWYPINLLAATVYSQSMRMSTGSLNEFHLDSFLLACLIHVITSVLVGLLYGAMLPMIPRRPIFLGGVVGPILWSGLVRSMMDLVNPLLARRVDWYWFIASQFAFGIVAGLVVVRQQRIPVKQFIPFRVRAGIETPGMMSEKTAPHRQENPE